MKKNCLTCSNEFDVPQRELSRGNGKYCSRKCSYERPIWSNRTKTIIELRCAFCDKCFEKQACRVREDGSKSGFRFCSRECKEQAQSLEGGLKEIQPSHYGTGQEFYGYRQKAFSLLPQQCNRCGYSVVTAVLEVHHKDRDRKNGDIENLEILCPTCHSLEHFVAKDGKWASGVIENTGGLHPPVVGL